MVPATRGISGAAWRGRPERSPTCWSYDLTARFTLDGQTILLTMPSRSVPN